MIRAGERSEDTSITNCCDGNLNFKISRAKVNASAFLYSSRNFIRAQRCWPWCGRNEEKKKSGAYINLGALFFGELLRYLNNFNCRCQRSAAWTAPVLLLSDCKVNPSYGKKRMFQLEQWGEIIHPAGQHSHLRIRITNLPPSIYFWQKKGKSFNPQW